MKTLVVSGDRQHESSAMAGDSMAGNAYQIEVDNVTESQWPELMSRFDDANIYQTWSYGAVRWQEENLSHLILKRNSDVLAMAQLRIIRPANLRLGIAYVRWGPMCHLRERELDPETVRVMATALRHEYVERRGLHLEILPNAFSGSVRAQIFQLAFGQFDHRPISAEKYRTFVLDLSPSLEELREGLDPKWRNKLSGAEKNGLRVAEGTAVDAYGVFRRMYTEMWARKRFRTSVDIEEFGQIQERLSGNQQMNVLICLHGQEPVAGIVCSAMGDSAIYLLGATSDNGLKLKGSYLLQWAMIRRMRENGIRYYDLGGIDPVENPGVYSFKSGFCGDDVHHIDSFVACDNGFSAALVKASQFLRGRVRRSRLAATQV